MSRAGCVVEPLADGAMFRLGYRFVVVGPDGRSWASHRTEAEARAVADQLNHPQPKSPGPGSAGPD